MAIQRVASAAARTVTNTTGTKLRTRPPQGGDQCGAPPEMGIARPGPLEVGEIHFRNWKTDELQVRHPNCVLWFFAVRDNTTY
jgi:hypothetical protein